MSAAIVFSAQFGGQDAAEAILPHFKALKSVSRDLSIDNFPFESLAFVLRVDGKVNSYNLSGLGNIDFDQDNYVSIDLGITQDDYKNCTKNLMESISSALRSSVTFLKNSNDAKLQNIDFESMSSAICRLCDAYELTQTS